MTTNYNEAANTFSGEIKLYSSEILQMFAGKKIKSATPCSELTARNNKKYSGIIVEVEGIALKVGFLPWEIRCLSVQHYPTDTSSVPVTIDSFLQKTVLDAALTCGGVEGTYYKTIADAIVGKVSGYHRSVGLNSKTKKTYENLTWIVVDSADKAIIDVTAKKEAE